MALPRPRRRARRRSRAAPVSSRPAVCACGRLREPAAASCCTRCGAGHTVACAMRQTLLYERAGRVPPPAFGFHVP